MEKEKKFTAERWNDKPNVKVISRNNELTDKDKEVLKQLKNKRG